MIDFSILNTLLSTSNSYGPNFGWLVTASFGFIAVIYAFLKWQRKTSLYWVKASAREKKKAWKKLKLPLSHHTWVEDFCHGKQPSTCCVCLTSVVSPQNTGAKPTAHSPVQRCSVCGVSAHFNCYQFARKDCKCVAQASFSHVLHHWSERWNTMDENSEMSAFCSYCDEPCGVPFIDASPTLINKHIAWLKQVNSRFQFLYIDPHRPLPNVNIFVFIIIPLMLFSDRNPRTRHKSYSLWSFL